MAMHEAPDSTAAIERFRTLLRIPTVSRLDAHETDWSVFDRFAEALPRLYPAVHSVTTREFVAERSMLYRWAGASAENPTVLMAHYDVVPVGDEPWEHPPFDAVLEGGVLHGRGTIDDKGALVAILEAAERLAASGFTPANDVYFSFGHDEEVAGTAAGMVVDVLKSRGIRPSLVLDEGGAIVEPGLVAGVEVPLAVIGVTEKGIMSVTLTVDQPGGHASTPPLLTSTARLARAIVRLTRSPFPITMNDAVIAFVESLAGHSSGARRTLFSNARRLSPIVGRLFSRIGDETRAMVRTTAAVTELHGSDGANVLPERASATVNVRIAVGSSVSRTVRHMRKAIRDEHVAIEVIRPSEPSPVSPSSGPAWQRIADAITAVYPDVAPTPYTMLAASDARHFTRISECVYRFTPFELHAEQRATLHARGEHIVVASWLRGIDIYERILRS